MSDDEFDRTQAVQEAQYEYPYHYVPRVEDGTFSRTRYWSWGHHYLGGLEVVLDELSDRSFDSLLDVGCGDGRFLAEAARNYPDVDLVGVDYSERSIALARGMLSGMGENVQFVAGDLHEVDLGKRFDIATAIEVFEHIPPGELDVFVRNIADALSPGGHLVATVPHANKPLQDKHYQHFTGKELRDTVDDYFEDLVFIPFDQHSYLLSGLSLLLGGKGNQFVVTNRTVNALFYRLYRRRYRYADTESNCRRIAVTGVKR